MKLKLTLLLLGFQAEAASLRRSLLSRTRRVAEAEGEEIETCGCSMCKGMALTEGGSDVWTCTAPGGGVDEVTVEDSLLPTDPDGLCKQEGDPSTWVVQTEQLMKRRFCHYTCKPVVPERLTTNVACERLDLETIQKYAQTATGSGRSFLWKSTRLQDSPTLDDIVAVHRTITSGNTVPTSERLRLMFKPIMLKRGTPKPYVAPACHCNCKQNATASAEAAAAALTATTTGPPLPMGPVGQAAIAAVAAAEAAAAVQAQKEAIMEAAGITADQVAQAQAAR